MIAAVAWIITLDLRCAIPRNYPRPFLSRPVLADSLGYVERTYAGTSVRGETPETHGEASSVSY